MSIVVDASMTISWLFASERTRAAQEVLRRVVDEGANVPSLWRLEVANVLRAAARLGRCSEAYVDRSLRRLERLSVSSDAETDRCAWTITLGLARRHNLTLYDAAYLELALRLGEPLATCDGALIAAGRANGLAVLTA